MLPLKSVCATWQVLCAINAALSLKSTHRRTGNLRDFVEHWEAKVAPSLMDINASHNTFSKKYITKYSIVVIVVCVFCICINVIATCVITWASSGGVMARFARVISWPIPLEPPYFSVISITLIFLDTAAWVTPVGLFIIICLILRCGFKTLAKHVEKTIQENKDLVPGNVIQIRGFLRELCRCTSILDNDYSYFIGNWFLAHVPVSCFNIYASLYLSMDTFLFSMIIFWTVSIIMLVAMVCIFAALVHEASFAPLEHIHDIKTQGMTVENLSELNLFMSKLTGRNTGFSVLTLVVITKEFILTIAGLYLTYIFLLLQFRV